jgi:hypothetical protein
MGFFDIEKVVAEIRTMKRASIKVVIILPPTFIYRSCVEAVEKAGPIIIELDDDKMAQFPEIVSEVFSRSGES